VSVKFKESHRFAPIVGAGPATHASIALAQIDRLDTRRCDGGPPDSDCTRTRTTVTRPLIVLPLQQRGTLAAILGIKRLSPTPLLAGEGLGRVGQKGKRWAKDQCLLRHLQRGSGSRPKPTAVATLGSNSLKMRTHWQLA